MIAIWIGFFIFVQAVVLIFVLALGQSTAQADREFEWARLAEQKPGQTPLSGLRGIKRVLFPPTLSFRFVSNTTVHVPNS